VALLGDWAGGGALLTSQPQALAGPTEDPFEVVGKLPQVRDRIEDAVGGGWFGYLGYQLSSRIEKLPPPPPRPVEIPHFDLAYYDHLLHYRPEQNQWWFEALWTPERAAALDARLELLRARLQSPPGLERSYYLGSFDSLPSDGGHRAAVSSCIDHIWAGDLFQANLCLRLEAHFEGDPIDLFCTSAEGLCPAYGALIRTPEVGVVSLSPELFLRRSGRASRAGRSRERSGEPPILAACWRPPPRTGRRTS
jgi:para-aminobenzoate synthetase/4-amino-4-deoxychorismate lyase